MKPIFTVILVVGLAAGIGWAGLSWSAARTRLRANQFDADVENLFIGLQKYKEHVGSYPTGSNAEIGKALMGRNAKNVIVVVGRTASVNEKGEFVDPWGTPLRIYFSDAGVLVRSAGANRRFDDSTATGSDDIFRSN
jgi:hypothetical protein